MNSKINKRKKSSNKTKHRTARKSKRRSSRTRRHVVRRYKGGDLNNTLTTGFTQLISTPQTTVKAPIVPPRPTHTYTLPEKSKDSCKLCHKLSISNEYDLCKSCENFVFAETDKLRSDHKIEAVSPIDALKGVFELTVVEILKKGSYHGLPAFTLLRSRTNNDATLSPIKKGYLNALININLNNFFRLADNVLNHNRYSQLNSPVAPITTPGDITRILEQISGLINEMNKTYNTQAKQSDEQIINYMKMVITDDLKKKLNVDTTTLTDITQLINYIKQQQSLDPTFLSRFSFDAQEYIKVLSEASPSTTPIVEAPKKTGFFTALFKR
jgi:hypothetical protein